MKIKNPKLFVISLALPQLTGFLGSVATTPNIPTWYAGLNKPSFNPPNWIFGPVWITLYTLMGIALYLVWQRDYSKKDIKKAVNIFLVHLVFNSLWSIVFFGIQNTGMAFVIILGLWFMIAYLIKAFYKIEKLAGYLLVPYILWVTFASILNFAIWRLN